MLMSGQKRKRWKHDHGAHARGVALPYGKQGILVTVDSNDPRKATKEAVSVLEEAWEELMQGAARKATPETAVEPAATGLEAKSKDGGDADKEQKDGAGPGTVEESKSAGAQGKNEDGEADEEPESAHEDFSALISSEVKGKKENGEADEEPGSAHEDFSALISSEVKDLKDKKKQPFVGYDTGIKTCLFVHMPLVSENTPGPNEVVSHVVRQAAETKVLRFRHCARFLPCTHICKPEMEDISKAAAAAVESALDCSKDAESKTVAVLYEHRAAPKRLERTKVIDEVISHVPRPPHTVKLKGASKTISIQVVRNAVGIAIVDDYHELGKYNVKEVCKEKEAEDSKDKDEKKDDAERK